MQGHNIRGQADFWIRTQDSWDWKSSEEGKGIRIASLNIRSGQAGGLEAALRALQQGNIDVGVLQETKLMRGVHTRYRAGCDVWETQA